MSIHVCYGPMFAGKTTKLQKEINNCTDSNKIVLKPLIDIRYSKNGIVSHDGERVNAETIKELDIHKVLKSADEEWITNRHIFIDEGHMFGDDLIRFCMVAKSKGNHVYVAGVEKVFDGSDFHNMNYLIGIADSTEYLQGECGRPGCKNRSVYSNLKELPTKLSKQIIVGGAELYEPLCEECFSKTN